MNFKCNFLVLFFTFFTGLSIASAQRVFLDSGHNIDFPGSIGTCGTPEVLVNDAVTDKLAQMLVQSGYRISINRLLNFDPHLIIAKAGRETPDDLRARGDRANRFRADIFVSIHHDSVPEEHLISDALACPGMKTTTPPLRISDEFLTKQQVGFNIFFTRGNNARKDEGSLKLASYVGEGFISALEVPSDYHIAPIEDCGSCRFENKSLGVLSRNLAVTRAPSMPAILIEITNLKDPMMEKKALEPAYQERVALIIKQAIDKYFGKTVTN